MPDAIVESAPAPPPASEVAADPIAAEAEADEAFQAAVAAAVDEVVDREQADRLEIRALTGVIEAYWQIQRQHDDEPDAEAWKGRTPPSAAVQKALDRMVIGAANRIAYMVESRLPAPAPSRGKGKVS